MIYIAVGCLGFVAIHLLDVVSLKRAAILKTFTWIPGLVLLVYSLVMVSLQPDKLPLSAWHTVVGWLLALISGYLLIYSLFLNLPFRETYVDTGVGKQLVTSGLYALVRHPGVHWFILFMLSLILISKARLFLVAAPIFIFLDIILVVVQDKYFFVKMFAGYDSYQKETPMLVPNRHSIIVFYNSLKSQTTFKVSAQGGINGRGGRTVEMWEERGSVAEVLQLY